MRAIDADTLINEIKKNRCADCDRRKGIKQGKMTFVYDFGEAPCRACDVGDTIDIFDEAPTVGGWISVKDRLPEKDEDVIIYGKYIGASGTAYPEMLISDIDEFVCSGYVPIAWMPRPEPPEEE